MKCPYCKKGILETSEYLSGSGKKLKAIVCNNIDCRCIWYGRPKED